MIKYTETPLVDESIEEYEYHEYDPITGTTLLRLLDTLPSFHVRCE